MSLPHISTTEHAYVQQLKKWVDIDSVSSDNWPEFTDKELYNYLVYSCKKTVDLQKKNARRQLRANIFYEDRHVYSVKYHSMQDGSDQCYVSCLVIPSAAASDRKAYPDCCVWIRLSTVTAHVNAAYCTCTAGLEGSCNHVAALLYALVDVTEHKRKGLHASTSQTCLWRADTKPSLPARPVQEFYFADYADLKSEMCHNIFLDFAAKCSMSPEDRCQTEEATRDQANSPIWFEARAGCLTSSHFGEINEEEAS